MHPPCVAYPQEYKNPPKPLFTKLDKSVLEVIPKRPKVFVIVVN
jgi:hypothetical protein